MGPRHLLSDHFVSGGRTREETRKRKNERRSSVGLKKKFFKNLEKYFGS